MMQKQTERVLIDYFPLVGGENLVDAAIAVQKGQLRFSSNYEPADTSGYRRIDGYERYDGHPRPSDAVFYAIPFESGAVEPTVGATVYGALSGARGVVLGSTVTSGSWATDDAVGYLAVTATLGAFIDGESLVDTIAGFDTGFDTGFQ